MSREQSRGITLIELISVVGLIAVVLSFALPTWHMVMANVTIEKEAARLTAAIQMAQTNAIREMRPWRVVLDNDGGGFRLQYRSASNGDPSACNPDGWMTASAVEFASEVRLSVSTSSRSCLPFGPTGRPIWPSPVIDPTKGTNPRDLGKLPYLLDGTVFRAWTSVINNPIHSEAPLAIFPSDNAITPSVLVFDLRELRYIGSPCLGLYSNPPTTSNPSASYVFPLSVQADVSTQDEYTYPMAWSLTRTFTVQRSVFRGPKEVTCLPIEINALGRWIRLTISPDTGFIRPKIVLHEFDLTPIYLDLVEVRSSQLARRIRIDSSTGRITTG